MERFHNPQAPIVDMSRQAQTPVGQKTSRCSAAQAPVLLTRSDSVVGTDTIRCSSGPPIVYTCQEQHRILLSRQAQVQLWPLSCRYVQVQLESKWCRHVQTSTCSCCPDMSRCTHVSLLFLMEKVARSSSRSKRLTQRSYENAPAVSGAWGAGLGHP